MLWEGSKEHVWLPGGLPGESSKNHQQGLASGLWEAAAGNSTVCSQVKTALFGY